MKFSGTDGNGPLNKCLNFGGDLDHRLDTGIVFRDLAEVCSVPVLLVFIYFARQIQL